jgi:mannonate dehydratase
MKITAARVIVTCPGRNFVTLKIETDQDLYGIGDATLNGREKSVVSYLEDHVCPLLLGRDPRAIEDIWQLLYRGAYWRRGPVTMRSISAVDVALWDLKAKSYNTPLYQVLGGASRDKVMVYGHANGRDIGETVEEVGRYIDLGYKAIRAQSGIAGIKDIYGVGRGSLFYEPADAALPTQTLWDTNAYLTHLPKLFEALRLKYDFTPHLLHDVHHRLSPREAASLGKSLEDYRLFWLEDPTPAENQEAFKLIREHTTTPLAVGEIFNTIWDCKDLIQNQYIDYIRTTVLGAGGITHLRRIADFAALWQIKTGSHGATDLSPVTMGAALHFDTWVPNFGIQEFMRHSPETLEVFPQAYRFENGFMTPGDAPGHGVDIDEALALKYPYEAKQLPIARLEDGTMWNW